MATAIQPLEPSSSHKACTNLLNDTKCLVANSQLFLGVCLILPIFWRVNSRCLVQVYVARNPLGDKKTVRSSSPPPTLTRQTIALCFCYESPLFLNILSCKFKKQNEYVVLGVAGMESNLVP